MPGAEAKRERSYGPALLSAPRRCGLPQRQHFQEVDSTQRVALDLARAGAMPGSLIVADRQSAGRGRLDHRWVSPPGGLYLSLLRPAPEFGGSLTPLAVGAGIAVALRPFSALPLLKWPNDLVVADAPRPARKLAGVLVDSVASPAGGRAVVVGVGVNVDSDPGAYPLDVRSRMVQLSELAGRPVGVDEVEKAVVPAIAAALGRLETAEGRSETLALCRSRLYGRGRRVRLDGAPVGVLEEVDDDGALVVAERGRRTRLVAGDLAVEEP